MKQRVVKGILTLLTGFVVLSNAVMVNAAVDEVQTVTGNNTASTQETVVTAEIVPSYTVTVPKHIALDEYGVATYDVTVKGDIATTQELVVAPRDMYTASAGDTTGNINFFLEEQVADGVTGKKDDVLVTINQEKVVFTHTDLEKSDDAGNNIGTTTTATVAASDSLSAGEWRGTFMFDISLNVSTSAIALINNEETETESSEVEEVDSSSEESSEEESSEVTESSESFNETESSEDESSSEVESSEIESSEIVESSSEESSEGESSSEELSEVENILTEESVEGNSDAEESSEDNSVAEIEEESSSVE